MNLYSIVTENGISLPLSVLLLTSAYSPTSYASFSINSPVSIAVVSPVLRVRTEITPLFLVLVANDDHIRNLVNLCFADFIANLLVAFVHGYAEALISQLLQTSLAHGILRSVIGMMRTCSGASHVGNAPAKCSVITPMKRSMEPENNAVDHNRTVLLAVCAGVLKLETLRQLHIQLDGATLPGTADGVCQMEVQLRTVERAVTPR